MVTALVDTSVVVDILRGYPAAQVWYQNQQDLGVSRAVWLEILEGVQNRKAQSDALKLLRRFQIEEIVTADVVWATERLAQLGLSHNVDAFDCMIAAVNQRLQLPLYTRNLKHFVPLIGTLSMKPY